MLVREGSNTVMPGSSPGITRTVAGSARPTDWGLAAALGLPYALAGAVATAPGAAAALPGEMAGAGRGLVAGAHVDDHRAVLADLAGDADGRGPALPKLPLV